MAATPVTDMLELNIKLTLPTLPVAVTPVADIVEPSLIITLPTLPVADTPVITLTDRSTIDGVDVEGVEDLPIRIFKTENDDSILSLSSGDFKNTETLKKVIEHLDIVNKDIISIFKKNNADIQIRTYENGAGETLSCGSASLCVATKFLNQNQSKLKVSSMGGELRFKLDKNGILMSGPASFSYKGNINE